MPHIAISVDMLDTGIDVPEVVNLVFFKACARRPSSGRWWGAARGCAGTCSAPGEHKQFFYLFDYCQNLEFFSQNPDLVEGSAGESLGTRLFKARLESDSELDRKVVTAGHRDGRAAARPWATRPTRGSCAQRLPAHLHQLVAAMNWTTLWSGRSAGWWRSTRSLRPGMR
jgi:type I restriction enzyme R subunit